MNISRRPGRSPILLRRSVIADLIRFYQTGDPKDWLQFGADWVRNDAQVDFANGFIEVYRDARGAKGSFAELCHGHR